MKDYIKLAEDWLAMPGKSADYSSVKRFAEWLMGENRDPLCTDCEAPLLPHHHRHYTRRGVFHTSCYEKLNRDNHHPVKECKHEWAMPGIDSEDGVTVYAFRCKKCPLLDVIKVIDSPSPKPVEWGSELGQILADFEQDKDEVKAVNAISSLLDSQRKRVVEAERKRVVEIVNGMRITQGADKDLIKVTAHIDGYNQALSDLKTNLGKDLW